MKCHKIDYEIFGDDMQVVEVELDPSETVVAEAGWAGYVPRRVVCLAFQVPRPVLSG